MWELQLFICVTVNHLHMVGRLVNLVA